VKFSCPASSSCSPSYVLLCMLEAREVRFCLPEVEEEVVVVVVVVSKVWRWQQGLKAAVRSGGSGKIWR
jgi:hypothetical protein